MVLSEVLADNGFVTSFDRPRDDAVGWLNREVVLPLLRSRSRNGALLAGGGARATSFRLCCWVGRRFSRDTGGRVREGSRTRPAELLLQVTRPVAQMSLDVDLRRSARRIHPSAKVRRSPALDTDRSLRKDVSGPAEVDRRGSARSTLVARPRISFTEPGRE